MKKSRFTESQIVAILKEGEAGVAVAQISRTHGIRAVTYYHWKSKYGGAAVSELKRLCELQAENTSSSTCTQPWRWRAHRNQGRSQPKTLTPSAKREGDPDHDRGIRRADRPSSPGKFRASLMLAGRGRQAEHQLHGLSR